MLLRLTDFQLAAVKRLSDAELDAATPSEFVERAVEFDARQRAEPRWRAPRPGPRRASVQREDTVLDTVLPAATGRAITLALGQILRVEQLADGQCVDLTAFEVAPPRRTFSAARTRSEHGIHPSTGTTLLSTAPEIPLLTIIEDTAGDHDLTFPACTAFEYEQPTGIPGHSACHEIHAAAQRRSGMDALVPDPLNLWLPSAVTASGELRSWPAACRRGDYVELRAETDVLVVLSACPDDLYGSSQYEPKPVRLIARTGTAPRGSDARPRITRALRTPVASVARHVVDVGLSGAAREHVELLLERGWLGFTPQEVTRALLCRYLGRRGSAAARSRRTASSART